jgi:hypothetical protein
LNVIQRYRLKNSLVQRRLWKPDVRAPVGAGKMTAVSLDRLSAHLE